MDEAFPIPGAPKSDDPHHVRPDFLICELDAGCFWQERPEDAIILYRDLLTKVDFQAIYARLYSNDQNMSQSWVWSGWTVKGQHGTDIVPTFSPRLVAWNTEDQKRIPILWTAFLRDLNSCTNPVCRLQAKFFEVTDAASEQERNARLGSLFALITTNFDKSVINEIGRPYSSLGGTQLL